MGPSMGATCTVCNHPQRAMIDAAITGGKALKPTATAFNLGYDAMRRHNANHLIPAQVAANPNGWQPPAGSSWAEKMEALALALEQGRVRSDVAAQLRMTYKDLDEANTGDGPVSVTMADVPGLAEMFGDLFLALDPFPQAREAMGRVMRKHGFIE